jgi:hypothetical protein
MIKLKALWFEALRLERNPQLVFNFLPHAARSEAALAAGICSNPFVAFAVFSFEPWHVLQSFQFVVTFSSNQIVYRSRRRRRRTTTTTTTTEPSTTMQHKTYLTYHEAAAPAPAFGKRRSCRVPLETP